MNVTNRPLRLWTFGIATVIGFSAFNAAAQSRILPHDSFCGGAAISRWSAEGGAYIRKEVFGKERGAWLQSLTGIAATTDNVFVYDGTGARLHVLDSSLRPILQFGRKGEGPGELAIPLRPELDARRGFTANYITADDSVLYVYDGYSIQAYLHDGTYIDRLVTVRQGMTPFSLRMLQVTLEGLFYSYDSLSFLNSGARRLQTWRVDAERPTLVKSVALKPPPMENRRYSFFSRDPHPLWTARGACLAWADGEAHRVVRTTLGSSREDTLLLPRHRVPPDSYDERKHRQLAEAMRSEPPPRRRDPSLWHWASMITDPDGHIWVRPWTASGRPEGDVVRIDPSGRVHRERVPMFPNAFGQPGVYYVREIDDNTDEVIVVRYERRNR